MPKPNHTPRRVDRVAWARTWRDADRPTPGPWRANGGLILADRAHERFTDVFHTLIVARVEDSPKARADSLLLAAAPELRAALHELVGTFANTDTNELPQLVAARRALAKSEGR